MYLLKKGEALGSEAGGSIENGIRCGRKKEFEQELYKYGRNFDTRRLASHLLARWFLVRLIFDPEDRGDIFRRNVDSYTDYTVLYPRKLQLSYLPV
jgi:hypothetical protein